MNFGFFSLSLLCFSPALIVIAVLFTCLAGSIDSLIIFCIALFIVVALLGFIMPIGIQLALIFQHKNAGTASALLGSL